MRPLFVVDAFSSVPFAGNPAAVCLLNDDEPDAWKQNLAAEMNLAETAFVLKRDDKIELRWFTPLCEVDLCGHATLASAHILWQEKWVELDQPIVFQSRSGELICRRVAGDLLELDFPLQPAGAVEPPPMLEEMLGLSEPPVEVLKNQDDYLVRLDSAEQLRAIQPSLPKLKECEARGWIVTAESDNPEYDIQSRFFAPACGINEDPVTGSAHCCLIDYWSNKLGKTELIGYQASRRGGIVRMAIRNNRAMLCGHAVTVVWGKCQSPRSGASDIQSGTGF